MTLEQALSDELELPLLAVVTPGIAGMLRSLLYRNTLWVSSSFVTIAGLVGEIGVGGGLRSLRDERCLLVIAASEPLLELALSIGSIFTDMIKIKDSQQCAPYER